MRRAFSFVIAAAEWFAITEVIYYYAHDEQRYLHTDMWTVVRSWVERQQSIRHTRDMIDNLPEL